MKVYHLNCMTMHPIGIAFINGKGESSWSARKEWKQTCKQLATFCKG